MWESSPMSAGNREPPASKVQQGIVTCNKQHQSLGLWTQGWRTMSSDANFVCFSMSYSAKLPLGPSAYGPKGSVCLWCVLLDRTRDRNHPGYEGEGEEQE